MQPFNEYLTGRTETVAGQELERLVGRHEWFTTARRAKKLLTGVEDPRLTLSEMFWPTIPPVAEKPVETQPQPEEPSPETVETQPQPEGLSPEDDIIGKFLEHGSYRIVPDEETDAEEVLTTDTFDDPEGELLTEELAEIYRSQGLAREAKEIYRKLSLLNPEKSIYFADVIAQVDSENNNN